GADRLDQVGGQPGRGDRVPHDLHDHRIGAARRPGAAQQRGAAGLEADRGRVGRDVRSALVDHPDDTHRDTDLLQLQAVRQGRAAHHLADRVREGGHVAHALGERRDAGLVEREPVDDVLRGAVGARLRHVLGVGAHDALRARHQRIGHRRQRRVLVLACRHRQPTRGLARTDRGLTDLGSHAGECSARDYPRTVPSDRPQPPAWRSLTEFGPHGDSHWVALRAAVTSGVPLPLLWSVDHVDPALPATFGAFTALYGRASAHPSRAAMQSSAAVVLVAAVASGTALAEHAAGPWAVALALTAAAAVAMLVSVAWSWHPPGV